MSNNFLHYKTLYLYERRIIYQYFRLHWREKRTITWNWSTKILKRANESKDKSTNQKPVKIKWKLGGVFELSSLNKEAIKSNYPLGKNGHQWLNLRRRWAKVAFHLNQRHFRIKKSENWSEVVLKFTTGTIAKITKNIWTLKNKWIPSGRDLKR